MLFTKESRPIESASSTSAKSLSEAHNFETYKQLKEVAKEEDPYITKIEIYERLLQPFKHEKRVKFDPETGKCSTLYICKYG